MCVGVTSSHVVAILLISLVSSSGCIDLDLLKGGDSESNDPGNSFDSGNGSSSGSGSGAGSDSPSSTPTSPSSPPATPSNPSNPSEPYSEPSSTTSAKPASSPRFGSWSSLQHDGDGDGIDDRIPDSGIVELLLALDGHLTQDERNELESLGAIVTGLSSDPPMVSIMMHTTSIPYIGDLATRVELAPEVSIETWKGSIGLEASDAYHTGFRDTHPTIKGQGVVVAVVDTGYDTSHQCFNDIQFVHIDAKSGEQAETEPTGSHGTAVACLVAQVAPEALMLLVHVPYVPAQGERRAHFDSGALANAVDLIRHHAEQQTAWAPGYSGVSIASLSLGTNYGTDGSDGLSRAVSNLANYDVLPIVSSGNNGGDWVSSPCAGDKVLCVGASYAQETADRADDVVASFSNRGPRADDGDSDSFDEQKPNLIAPGQWILTADMSDGGYSLMSGTSFSTPIVSGVAALRASAVSSSVEELRAAILDAVDTRGATSWAAGVGLGLLDVRLLDVDGSTEGSTPPATPPSTPPSSPPAAPPTAPPPSPPEPEQPSIPESAFGVPEFISVREVSSSSSHSYFFGNLWCPTTGYPGPVASMNVALPDGTYKQFQFNFEDYQAGDGKLQCGVLGKDLFTLRITYTEGNRQQLAELVFRVVGEEVEYLGRIPFHGAGANQHSGPYLVVPNRLDLGIEVYSVPSLELKRVIPHPINIDGNTYRLAKEYSQEHQGRLYYSFVSSLNTAGILSYNLETGVAQVVYEIQATKDLEDYNHPYPSCITEGRLFTRLYLENYHDGASPVFQSVMVDLASGQSFSVDYDKANPVVDEPWRGYHGGPGLDEFCAWGFQPSQAVGETHANIAYLEHDADGLQVKTYSTTFKGQQTANGWEATDEVLYSLFFELSGHGTVQWATAPDDSNTMHVVLLQGGA